MKRAAPLFREGDFFAFASNDFNNLDMPSSLFVFSRFRPTINDLQVTLRLRVGDLRQIFANDFNGPSLFFLTFT